MRLGPQEAENAVAQHLQSVRDSVVMDSLTRIAVPRKPVHVKQQARCAVEIREIRAGEDAASVVHRVLFVGFRQGSVGPDRL